MAATGWKERRATGDGTARPLREDEGQPLSKDGCIGRTIGECSPSFSP
jgi:hypothetical protein